MEPTLTVTSQACSMLSTLATSMDSHLIGERLGNRHLTYTPLLHDNRPSACQNNLWTAVSPSAVGCTGSGLCYTCLHTVGQTPRKIFASPHPSRHMHGNAALPLGIIYGIAEDYHLLTQGTRPLKGKSTLHVSV